ncbi:MAG: GAF domain-containing protein [bacterium]|nr:GAF domain-containing protein [bacterium]
MTALLKWLFNIEQYPERADQDMARLTYGVTFVLIVFMLFINFLVPFLDDGGSIASLFGTSLFITVSMILMVVLGIGTLAAVRTGRLDLARWGVPLLFVGSPLFQSIGTGITGTDDGTLLVLCILVFAVFQRERGTLIGFVVAIGALLLGNWRLTTTDPTLIDSLPNQIALTVQLVGVAMLMFLFLRNNRIDEMQRVSAASEERLKLAELTRQIAGSVLRRTELQATLTTAIEEIRTQYPRAYHVQIFLVDEARRNAKLAASTGEIGQMLLGRGHSLTVGSVSVIGQVTAKNEIVVARSGSTATVHKRNEFLPETVVEAAFPLRSGTTVIGALDMQSKQANAFPDDELPIFQALADNIAIAIDNALLLEQAEVRVAENKRLAEQSAQALREVERLNSQLTADSWRDYLATQGAGGVTIDFDKYETTTRSADFTPTLSEALRFSHVVQRETDDGLIIAAPVLVRGQVIGALELELEGKDPVDPQVLDLIETVCERLGLSAESARLYEESRRAAHREATLNEIARQMQATNSINTIMAEAARGIQRSFGAERVAIRLGPPPSATNGTRKE